MEKRLERSGSAYWHKMSFGGEDFDVMTVSLGDIKIKYLHGSLTENQKCALCDEIEAGATTYFVELGLPGTRMERRRDGQN